MHAITRVLCVSSRTGAVAIVSPTPRPTPIHPHAAAAPADFPKSFPSVAEAVAHLRRLVGFVTPALAEKVIVAAATEVLKANPGVGWKATMVRPLGRSKITDTYLGKAANLIVLRYVHRRTGHACSLNVWADKQLTHDAHTPPTIRSNRPEEWNSEPEDNLEGERFFCRLNFLRALMDAEVGEAGARSFPGLGQKELTQIVVADMFTGAAAVLEQQTDSWQVDVELGDDVDGIAISYRADGCV